MPTTTTNLSLNKPTVGGDTDAWGGQLNTNFDTLDAIFKSDGTGTGVGLNISKAQVAAGTAAAPTLYGASDTNTGVFFPAADTVGVSTGGAERLRVNSSGQVGVGTTTPGAPVDVRGANSLGIRFLETDTGNSTRVELGTGSGVGYINANAGTGAIALAMQVAGTERVRITSDGQIAAATAGSASAPVITKSDDLNTGIFFPAADTIAFAEGGVEAMRIDSSGNVGVGTTSPQTLLDVGAGSTSAPTYKGIVRIKAPASQSLSADGGIEFVATTFSSGYGYRIGAFDLTNGSVPLVFQSRQNSATWTERMRIDESGNVGIGTSSPAAKLSIKSGSSGDGLFIDRSGASAVTKIQFRNEAGAASTAILNLGTSDGMSFETGGANERMRIDSSGNVGIGTSAPTSPLTLGNNKKFAALNTGGSDVNLAILNGSNNLVFGDDSVNTGTLTVQSRGDTIFSLNTAERMRITAAGNVGIGTSSPDNNANYKTLTITGATTTTGGVIGLKSSDGSAYAQIFNDSSGFALKNNSNTPALFYTNGTERMRITSGGEVYIAGTTDQGAYNLQCNGTGVWGAGAYVNGSDARIKDDIAPIESGLDVVEKLNPVTYRYKEDWSKDQSTQTGFIAQELLVALEGKNYVDGVVQQGGSEGYYSVAYQNIIPILTKAIQELSAKVDSLQAEVNQLKGN